MTFYPFIRNAVLVLVTFYSCFSNVYCFSDVFCFSDVCCFSDVLSSCKNVGFINMGRGNVLPEVDIVRLEGVGEGEREVREGRRVLVGKHLGNFLN